MKLKSSAMLILLLMIISCGGDSPKGSLQSFLDAPGQDNYNKFLRYSLKAQMLTVRADENGMTAEQYFEKWKRERGKVVGIKEFGMRHPFYFENLYQTEAITYTATYKIPGYKAKVDNDFQLVLISDEIKTEMTWLEADAGQWVVMDNLFY